jgi:hypothetical protein
MLAPVSRGAGFSQKQYPRADHSTFGKSGHFAPHRSLQLSADFFGQSAVI